MNDGNDNRPWYFDIKQYIKCREYPYEASENAIISEEGHFKINLFQNRKELKSIFFKKINRGSLGGAAV